LPVLAVISIGIVRFGQFLASAEIAKKTMARRAEGCILCKSILDIQSTRLKMQATIDATGIWGGDSLIFLFPARILDHGDV
jgi:hypothetical protein